MPSPARARLAWGYFAVGCILTVGYFGLHSVAAQDLWYDGIGLSAVVAILAGVWLHRPRRPLPWLLVAAGQFLWILGDTIWDYYDIVLHRSVPYPAAPDLFYLSGYFLVAMANCRSEASMTVCARPSQPPRPHRPFQR